MWNALLLKKKKKKHTGLRASRDLNGLYCVISQSLSLQRQRQETLTNQR